MTHVTTIPEYNAEVVWDSAKTHTVVSLIISVPFYLDPEKLSDILPYAAHQQEYELDDDTSIVDVAEIVQPYIGFDAKEEGTQYRLMLASDVDDEDEYDRVCAAADAVIRRLFGLEEDPT